VTEDTDTELRRKLRIRVAAFLVCVAVVVPVLAYLSGVVLDVSRLGAVEAERDRWQRPAEVIRALELRKGDTVADLGSGVGYFALKLAAVVGPQGEVVAVDILRWPLLVLRGRALARGASVRTLRGEVSDPHLPPGVHAVLIADTYHELSDPRAILASVRRSLRPGARLVILDRGPRPGGAEAHEVAADEVERQLRASGFELVAREDAFIDDPSNGLWWLIVARSTPPA
jgi:predicted methyltransferase